MLCQLPNGLAYFIHVPKTAGNTVQQALIQAGCSTDEIVVNGHQDGRDRFDLRGATTCSKHQPLAHYHQCDPTSVTHPVMICVRRPLQRLVSLYFSPHRWFRRDKASGRYLLPDQAPFCEHTFAELVAAAPAAVDYLADASPCTSPALAQQRSQRMQHLQASGQLSVIKTEQLATDFEAAFGFPLAVDRRNVSPYREQAQRVLASATVAELVASSHHQLDLQLFYV